MAYRQTARLTALCLAAAAPAAAAERGGDMFIRGVVAAAPGHAAALRDSDRLVIKIFHPGGEVEHDPKYKYVRDFSLPAPFAISPPIDMNGAARWPVWRVEIFTDRDGDVLSVVDGELFAATPELLPLGSSGVMLELAPRAPDR